MGVIGIVYRGVPCTMPGRVQCVQGMDEGNGKRVRAEKIALYAIYVQISSLILRQVGEVGEAAAAGGGSPLKMPL